VLIFSHTYLLFKDLARTYFCEIYVILWDFIRVKKIRFQLLKFLARSTGPGVGRPNRSTDMHERHAQASHSRPVDRTVDRLKAPNSRVLAGDRAVDRRHNGQKYDRCAGRPGDLPGGHFCPFLLPTRIILIGL